MVGVGATARERRNGERGTGQELTVDSTASSETRSRAPPPRSASPAAKCRWGLTPLTSPA